MLGQFRARLTYHAQACKSGLYSFCHKPLTTLMTVIVIAITLTLPALFWVFTDNLQQLTGDWQRGGHISLYLDSSISSADESALVEKVKTTQGVGKAALKSSAEGLFELQQQEGMQDIMQYLPDNPLPSVIDVVPALDVTTSQQVSELYQMLKSYPHVAQAKFDMQWVSRLYTLLDIASRIADGLMILLATAVVLVIGNTLRMAIQNRHEEIQVLKFIGAGHSYIIRPFLYLGIFYGVVGALLAMLLVHLINLSLSLLVNQLAETYQMHYALMGLSLRQAAWLLLSAIALGWLGARLSVSSLCRTKFG